MAKKKMEDKPAAPPPARTYRRRGLAGKFDLLVAWATRVAKGKDLTTKDKARAAATALCAASPLCAALLLSSAPPEPAPPAHPALRSSPALPPYPASHTCHHAR